MSEPTIRNLNNFWFPFVVNQSDVDLEHLGKQAPMIMSRFLLRI